LLPLNRPHAIAFAMLEDRILFIDGEAIVLDKPAGLPVDPPKRGGDSLAARINELKCGFQRPPVVMHRLDQDTSGCLLLARNPKARAAFQQAFEARAVEKYYLAVIGSEIAGDEGVIDLAIAKISSAEAGWRMVGDPRGQSAVTRWRKVKVRDGRTLVEFRPLTGRTHQIRVHARLGFGSGIVGDRGYGISGGAMLLHAARLVVPRIRGPAIDVTAPQPESFGEWRDEG
jgi:tRNA pseudouridine32 synthase/23S rRNA pseudouridine746 synthase